MIRLTTFQRPSKKEVSNKRQQLTTNFHVASMSKAAESWPALHQPYTTSTTSPILRFSNFRPITEQPKSSCEGYLQPPNKSSAKEIESVSFWISGDIVTWVIPYPVKHCCMYRSVISHCLNDVPARIRTWRDARTILKTNWKSAITGLGGRGKSVGGGGGTCDCERFHTWTSWIERTSGSWG